MQENRQEKSQIKRNISLYLSEKGVSDYEFYKKSGITRGILSQPNGISEDNIARFLAYAPDVNTDWLLTGRGPMLKTKRTTSDLPTDGRPGSIDKGTKKDSNHQENQQLSSDRPLAIPSSSPEEGIPLIPIEAMAGALTSEQTVLEYECERYVVPVFKGADFLIPVKGSSMYPKYSSGDIVACQRVPMSGLFFQWNKVYVLDTDQGPLIKRIKPGSTTDRILIISDNQDYDPFELPVSSIHAVSLVIGVIRLE